jgi:hypothetical protein
VLGARALRVASEEPRGMLCQRRQMIGKGVFNCASPSAQIKYTIPWSLLHTACHVPASGLEAQPSAFGRGSPTYCYYPPRKAA